MDFPQYANFGKAAFTQDADFSKATFTACVGFGGVTFARTAEGTVLGTGGSAGLPVWNALGEPARFQLRRGKTS